jgi:hypothetical protein
MRWRATIFLKIFLNILGVFYLEYLVSSFVLFLKVLLDLKERKKPMIND